MSKHQGAPLTPIGGRRGKKRLTSHHCIPRSRNGPDTLTNIRPKGVREHYAWHQLFRNMTPDEVIASIQERRMEGITRHNNFKIGYWRIVFGDKTTAKDCAEIVKKYWTPPGAR